MRASGSRTGQRHRPGEALRPAISPAPLPHTRGGSARNSPGRAPLRTKPTRIDIVFHGSSSAGLLQPRSSPQRRRTSAGRLVEDPVGYAVSSSSPPVESMLWLSRPENRTIWSSIEGASGQFPRSAHRRLLRGVGWRGCRVRVRVIQVAHLPADWHPLGRGLNGSGHRVGGQPPVDGAMYRGGVPILSRPGPPAATVCGPGRPRGPPARPAGLLPTWITPRRRSPSSTPPRRIGSPPSAHSTPTERRPDRTIRPRRPQGRPGVSASGCIACPPSDIGLGAVHAAGPLLRFASEYPRRRPLGPSDRPAHDPAHECPLPSRRSVAGHRRLFPAGKQRCANARSSRSRLITGMPAADHNHTKRSTIIVVPRLCGDLAL
jgi:hypothetical protein